MGLVEAQGSVRSWKEQELLGHKAYEIARHGHRLCAREPRHLPQADRGPEPAAGPEGRQEARLALELDDMYQMFPRLKERQHTEAGVLSGGEQQMLTLCRTLMGDPDLIMIDEPTEGLAPKIVELVGEYLRELQKPRPGRAAGGAEAHHRPGHLAALLCDGPRRDRLRRHAR
jgi:branched-chain amino acid transport system ATP-binding protein